MAATTLRCQASDCGKAFVAQRAHARTCSHRCRQRLYVEARAAQADDLQRQRLSDLARNLVIAGELDPFEALALVISPTETIRAALEEIAA